MACHILDNMIHLSDHLPVVIMLKSLSVINDNARETSAKNASAHNHRLRWDHANLSNYYSLSYSALQPILNILDNFYVDLNTTSSYNAYSDRDCCREQLSEGKANAVTVIESVYDRLITTLSDTARHTIPSMGATTLKHW